MDRPTRKQPTPPPDDQAKPSPPAAPPPNRHAATAYVSVELLEDWLDLPVGVTVEAAYPPEPYHGGPGAKTVALYLVDSSGKWLPEQREGACPESCTANYYHDDISSRPRLQEFVSGNLTVRVPPNARRQRDVRFWERVKKARNLAEEANRGDDHPDRD